MNDELVRTGQALSNEKISALDEFGDARSRMARIAKNEVVGAMAEALIAIQRLTGSSSLMGSEAIRRTIGDAKAEIDNRQRSIEALEKRLASGNSGGRAESSLRIERQKLEEASKRLEELQDAYSTGREQYGPSRGTAEKAKTPDQASAERRKATQEIKEMTRETEKLSVEMEKVEDNAIVSARVVKDSFGDALESATFDFENFGDSVDNVLEGIARNIARRAWIDPLSGGIENLIFGSSGARPSPDFVGPMQQGGGLLDSIFGSVGSFFGVFFAEGGRPPGGKASIVGENGPEWFIPDTAGTVYPNGSGMGGQSINVSHTWNIQSGVTRQELAAMLPLIEARSTAATMAAIEKGGRAAQIVGKRNG